MNIHQPLIKINRSSCFLIFLQTEIEVCSPLQPSNIYILLIITYTSTRRHSAIRYVFNIEKHVLYFARFPKTNLIIGLLNKPFFFFCGYMCVSGGKWKYIVLYVWLIDFRSLTFSLQSILNLHIILFCFAFYFPFFFFVFCYVENNLFGCCWSSIVSAIVSDCIGKW